MGNIPNSKLIPVNFIPNHVIRNEIIGTSGQTILKVGSPTVHGSFHLLIKWNYSRIEL